MKITIEPTPEIYDGPINGVKVPMRIWSGMTDAGIPIEAYVFSITPNNEEDIAAFKDALPFFMIPSKVQFQIDGFEQEKKQ